MNSFARVTSLKIDSSACPLTKENIGLIYFDLSSIEPNSELKIGKIDNS